MKKILSTTKENSLLELRRAGLEDIRTRESMQPLGKYQGMDAFSWANPNFETLASVLSSFPFKVIWLGTHEQMRCALKYYPEVMKNIESAVIYDRASIKFDVESLVGVQNIIGTANLDNAFHLIDALKESKRILFFTSEGENQVANAQQFKSFIKD
jgi:hypothetical protein